MRPVSLRHHVPARLLHRPGRILLLAGVVTTVAGALAQPAPPTVADPDSALARTLQANAGEPLALDVAIGAALAEDTDVLLARAERDAAAGAARRERGTFSPELYGEVSTGSDEQPSSSFFSGADVLVTDRTAVEAGARMTLPLGTQLSASLNSTRVKTNSAFSSLSPQVDAVGELSITQPLLRGFGPAARGERDATAASYAVAQASYDDARLAAAAEVEVTYWRLYATERDYAVQLLVRDQAQAVLDQSRIRAQTGLVGPSAVATARVFLAKQAQAVLDSEDQLDSVSDHLATLIGRRPATSRRFHAIGLPPSTFPPIDQDALVRLVAEHNRLLEASTHAVAAARARASGARWDALPQLDLFGQLGGRGLAGTGQDVIIDFGGSGPDTVKNTVDTGFGDAFSQVVSRDYPQWNVGLRFTVPFGGPNRGERDRLDAAVVRAEAQHEANRRTLDEAVRSWNRELTNGHERLRLAQEGVHASIEQVRIGMLEFKNGRTTAFELVRLSADLADAQRAYSNALVRTAQAAASLRRLTAGAYPGPLTNEETNP